MKLNQHKDVYGNPISEPDKSNPTRSRWERPLDTIRSFEAAIDGPYRRPTLNRPQSEADWNRRGSIYGNGNRNYAASRAQSLLSVPGNSNRYPQDNYYGSRPTSHFDPRPSPRDSYHDPQHYGGYPPYGSNGNGGFPGQNGYGGAPDLTDLGLFRPDIAYQTAPVPAHDYGIGFQGQPAYQPQPFSVHPNGQGPVTLQKKPVPGTLASNLPPTVPRKDVMPRANLAPAKPQPEKRKSWLFRRFSRNS
ncbi:unnamed protein product [Parascedosporium putredinis]|uniref:DUF2406 domain-containing protein n=1 Tax=Parascedosporium putredinis TaxID=1442378 RepID=A0A9P1H585_9PEZI|nr:unnamed protein product [Parascedosporium putredinis]CAI7997584.1 unnamed protein product [Parascedosporium putredinis]